ncbi:acyl-CoA dehydrogenase family protein [Paraburkholderia sp. MMS20-SJTN17]|uniref:Acyl-CoA dehydrogenase family protein n=1 Tax=Paraburkholderia translucens TaxID=2886945 RepID=A0ABS8KC41_9BURK|nr:acyl-CoA dehydrogenase family protein [Paraburkholderia sp. MMS20-SJTN17]MCC8402336.1 acyl-CoA dehydrogenase family protein [Paraburkholderia sp. MMS20-SJTN17]
MKLEFSAEDQAFRAEVREFVKQNLSPRLKRKTELGLRIEREDYVEWYTKLYEKGWIAPSWKKEHGGPGWTHVQRYIFDEETLLGGAPRIVASGINMLGPVLNAFGTPEQKAKYIPKILRSETWWAQGFSEPGAGSDLAAVRTTAVLDGDHFVVNGHKVWTSYAHWCDMMFALVRTDPGAKPQEGISFLLIDMHAPGVEVRPIRMLEGGTDLNEVYLDNVRVPKENLVGELNKGWTYGKFLLGHERTGIAGIGSCKQQLARAKHLAKQQGLENDPLLQSRISRFEVEVMALEFTGLRMLSANQASRVPSVEAPMLKVRGTELRQGIYALLTEIAGPFAVPFDEQAMLDMAGYEGPSPDELIAVAANYFDARKVSIYGGTNEVQRNLISRAFFNA